MVEQTLHAHVFQSAAWSCCKGRRRQREDDRVSRQSSLWLLLCQLHSTALCCNSIPRIPFVAYWWYTEFIRAPFSRTTVLCCGCHIHVRVHNVAKIQVTNTDTYHEYNALIIAAYQIRITPLSFSRCRIWIKIIASKRKGSRKWAQPWALIIMPARLAHGAQHKNVVYAWQQALNNWMQRTDRSITPEDEALDLGHRLTCQRNDVSTNISHWSAALSSNGYGFNWGVCHVTRSLILEVVCDLCLCDHHQLSAGSYTDPLNGQVIVFTHLSRDPYFKTPPLHKYWQCTDQRLRQHWLVSSRSFVWLLPYIYIASGRR